MQSLFTIFHGNLKAIFQTLFFSTSNIHFSFPFHFCSFYSLHSQIRTILELVHFQTTFIHSEKLLLKLNSESPNQSPALLSLSVNKEPKFLNRVTVGGDPQANESMIPMRNNHSKAKSSLLLKTPQREVQFKNVPFITIESPTVLSQRQKNCWQ